MERQRPPIISSEIVLENGGNHLKTYYKGDNPVFGTPIEGWSGPETVRSQPIAVNVFNVNNGK